MLLSNPRTTPNQLDTWDLCLGFSRNVIDERQRCQLTVLNTRIIRDLGNHDPGRSQSKTWVMVGNYFRHGWLIKNVSGDASCEASKIAVKPAMHINRGVARNEYLNDIIIKCTPGAAHTATTWWLSTNEAVPRVIRHLARNHEVDVSDKRKRQDGDIEPVA
jgi:hypothetical protein